MIEVESGDVLEMREERFAELLDEINAKQSQLPLSTVLGFGSALAGFLVLAVAGPGGLLALAMALPAWALGRWLDSYKRRTVLFYDLDADAAAAYEAVTGAFDEILNCRGKWHVEAGGTVRDLNTWKRNAGASHLVNKKPTTFSYAAPAVIATNITPPSVQVGRQTVYFLPDAVLVVDRANVGAVGYDDLQLQWQDSAFIEEGTVPSDAEVIGHAWKHPNKNGGPDRRFSNNYQIPICRYEVLHLSSPTGLNEMLELSRTGVSEPFARALKELTHRTGASRQALSSPLAKIT